MSPLKATSLFRCDFNQGYYCQMEVLPSYACVLSSITHKHMANLVGINRFDSVQVIFLMHCCNTVMCLIQTARVMRISVCRNLKLS